MKRLIYLAAFLFVAGCAPKPAPVTDAWEQERMERIKLDFCMSESQVKEYIRKYIPDVTNEQMRAWEESKALECMEIDGEKRYFRNAGPNLFRIDSAAYCIKIAKEGTQLSGSEKVNKEHLPEVMSAVRATGTDTVLPKRMRVTYTLTVEPNAVPSK